MAELEHRGLTLPAISPRVEEPVQDAQTWVTVERFRDLSAGIVARGALEAAAIPCFLRDENTVRMDWQISNLIGGMRLQVPLDREADARETLAGLALDEDPASDAGGALQDERCPACDSTNIARRQRYRGLSILSVWMFGVPLALKRGKPEWHCAACGAEWPEVTELEFRR